MSRQVQRNVAWLLVTVAFLTGCHPVQPAYLFEDGDLSHYKGVATEIEYPDDHTCTLAEVEGALPPLTLSNADAREIWDLRLEEAIQITLANSKVVRTINGRSDLPSDVLLRLADSSVTVYGPALVETNPIRGVEAALSAFDAQLRSNVTWQRNDRPVNIGGVGGLLFAPVFKQDLGTFQTTLQKINATGGTMSFAHNVAYEWNNNPSRAIPSDWNVNFEATFRQPLLQGAGVEFNRIAGPNAQPGFFFSNGVMIARINMDVSLADFELSIRNLVSDVEISYWDLYFAYRQLDAVLAGRDSALETWRKVAALRDEGAKGGELENEAQAREQYYLFRGQVQEALSRLYGVENRLRYLMGLAATDGRLIRPSDEPTVAEATFDWYEIHSEALTRSAELRRQKFRVKQRELELVASRNFLLPRLDALGTYRWMGLGDDLIDPNGKGFGVNESSGSAALLGTDAYSTLFDGNFEEWQLGLQLQVPIGFRQAMSSVRNAQLQLARERAVLQDQELELSHLLSEAKRQLELTYATAVTQYNRRVAAVDEVRAAQVRFNVGAVTLDLLLDAQRRLADAESAYFQAITAYNKAIAQMHLRKGSLLEYNGVYLAEGPWPGKAYFDAQKRARERDASFYMNYGYTRPSVMSRGPYQQIGPNATIGGPHQPAEGSYETIVPGEQMQPTPVEPTNEPPLLNGSPMGRLPQPGVRRASAEMPVGTQQSSFSWGKLGLPGEQPGISPSADPAVQPASFNQPQFGTPAAAEAPQPLNLGPQAIRPYESRARDAAAPTGAPATGWTRP
ncbi:MAG: TolC family protein [Pirellulales bacterium]|nr:TolC family protein [Pirellulales bacterium]